MGHRLAHREVGETLGRVSGEKKTLRPRKALRTLFPAGATEAETLEFSDDDRPTLIGDGFSPGRKLTVPFPNYEAVLPRITTSWWTRAFGGPDVRSSAWRSCR